LSISPGLQKISHHIYLASSYRARTGAICVVTKSITAPLQERTKCRSALIGFGQEICSGNRVQATPGICNRQGRQTGSVRGGETNSAELLVRIHRRALPDLIVRERIANRLRSGSKGSFRIFPGYALHDLFPRVQGQLRSILRSSDILVALLSLPRRVT
jgi:hypothetical protein